MSYFSLATDKVKKYFSKFVSDDSINGDVWFSFHGNPVKLHLPIGLIYDQMKVSVFQKKSIKCLHLLLKNNLKRTCKEVL